MSFNDIFKSNFLENITNVSILDMAIALVLAFGLGVFFSSFTKRPIRALCTRRASVQRSSHSP